jgi:very-short-patch-repair endonuclease
MNRVRQAAAKAKVHFAREQRKQATKGERLLWQALRGSRLGVKFRRQHPLGQFVLDFYCEEAQLAVEVDGVLHEKRQEYDAWRDKQLAEYGVRVLHVWAEHVEYDVVLVCDRVRAALGEDGESLTPGPSPSR